MSEPESFGEWLRAQRVARDLTREGLAAHIGCSASALRKLETGARRPSKELAEHLARYFGFSAAATQRFVAFARAPGATTTGAQATSATPAPPGNVPSAPTALIGRAPEVAAITALVRRPSGRLVTLLGPPGVGKTRLSLAVAAALRGAFAQGVWWVPLAAQRDPALVAPAILQALGLAAGGNQAAPTALCTHLRDRQALLVLDNLEQISGVAALIGELLTAAPGLKVLATSRFALQLQWEQRYPVAPLPVPAAQGPFEVEALEKVDAVALFVARARAVQPAFALTPANAAAVAAICLRLDGLPLAIELAAARTRLLPPAALLARLERQLPLLTSGARDLPLQHQTLRDAIAWSYDLLDAREQAVFRGLGIFVRGCTLAAAEAVVGDQEPALRAAKGSGIRDQRSGFAVLDTLADLVDKSLLRPIGGTEEEPRFGLLETIREYALEQLAAAGETDALAERHGSYYLALAERAMPELSGQQQAHWLACLDAEHDNLRAALRWAHAQGAAVLGWRLAGALWRFWWTRGYWSEGRAHLTRALALVPAPDDPGTWAYRATAANGAGSLAAAQGDYAAATALYTESLTLYRRLGDPGRVASTLNNLANLAWYSRDYAAARVLYEESLALWQAAGDKAGCALALGNLGNVVLSAEDYAAARAFYSDSLALLREL
ncbi:MAG TPA: tetratricopeptide repeat protein, partial [Chloroflexia bacterium]|nr:tetratricopeptide repeat protein [Chloroflexia bacterium]